MTYRQLLHTLAQKLDSNELEQEAMVCLMADGAERDNLYYRITSTVAIKEGNETGLATGQIVLILTSGDIRE